MQYIHYPLHASVDMYMCRSVCVRKRADLSSVSLTTNNQMPPATIRQEG